MPSLGRVRVQANETDGLRAPAGRRTTGRNLDGRVISTWSSLQGKVLRGGRRRSEGKDGSVARGSSGEDWPTGAGLRRSPDMLRAANHHNLFIVTIV